MEPVSRRVTYPKSVGSTVKESAYLLEVNVSDLPQHVRFTPKGAERVKGEWWAVTKERNGVVRAYLRRTVSESVSGTIVLGVRATFRKTTEVSWWLYPCAGSPDHRHQAPFDSRAGALRRL